MLNVDRQQLVVLYGICALICFTPAQGMTLSPCVNDGGSVNVAEITDRQSTRLTCRGIPTSEYVEWRYVSSTTGELGAGVCPPPGQGNCQVGLLGAAFTASRSSSSESVMAVDNSQASGGSLVSQGSLYCQFRPSMAAPAVTSTSDTCQLDVITAAQGTCSVQFDTTGATWQTTGTCTMTRASSSRGRYYCLWYRNTESTGTKTTYSASNKVCTFSSSLPSQAGQYSYTVTVTPGQVSIPASFTGGNQIEYPATPTITGCGGNNVYVAEFGHVTCICQSSSVGKPQGRLVWRNATSDVNSGMAGVASLPWTSSQLSRGDHVFTCRVVWSDRVTQSPVTVQVGYIPEDVSINIGSTAQDQVTVNENDTVTLTCQANARPVATLTLTRQGEGQINSGQSPLSRVVERARCEDTGQYVCSAYNSLGQADNTVTKTLLVTCSPRSTTTDLGKLNFATQTASLSFDVTSYPAPSSTFTFMFSGVNGTDTPTQVKDIEPSARCEVRSEVNQFTCYIIVLNVTSLQAVGFYTVRVTNDRGGQLYRFQVLYNELVNPQNQPATGADGAVIGGSIAAVIVVIAIVLVIVVILKRKGVSIPIPKRKATSEDSDNNPAQLQEEEPQASGNDDTARQPGTYSSLFMSDIGLRSVYSSLQQRNSTLEEQDSENAYYNTAANVASLDSTATQQDTRGAYEGLNFSDVGQKSIYTDLTPRQDNYYNLSSTSKNKITGGSHYQNVT